MTQVRRFDRNDTVCELGGVTCTGDSDPIDPGRPTVASDLLTSAGYDRYPPYDDFHLFLSLSFSPFRRALLEFLTAPPSRAILSL